jgi:hypothetical protein
MNFLRNLLCHTLFIVCVFFVFLVHADEGYSKKGQHFIIYCQNKNDIQWAGKVLEKADAYYDSLASMMGYARYSNYWSWEERVRIIVYSDEEQFHKETGMPSWSKAGALRDNYIFDSRVIVTFKQENNFLEGILPHEISHLMLHDYIGHSVPLWFDEGIAQHQEEGKKEMADRGMRILLKQDLYIPFYKMSSVVLKDASEQQVTLFYVQSVSMIHFLITKFGHDQFQELLHAMKEGKSFESALLKGYSSIESLEDFEKKWLRYLKNL